MRIVCWLKGHHWAWKEGLLDATPDGWLHQKCLRCRKERKLPGRWRSS